MRSWQRLTYSTQRSTFSLGTATPALRAERRAMIWQMVTEMSASVLCGV